MKVIRKIVKFLGELSKKKVARPKLLLRLSVVLALFALLIFLAQLWNSNQPIHQISIVGTSFLTPAEVKAEIQDAPIINRPKNEINYAELAKRLRQNPFIENTYLSEGINTLTIEVKERQPVAILVDNYGKLRYVSSDYSILPYRLFNTYLDIPVITGIYKDELLDSLALRNAIDIINHIRAYSNTLLISLISEVHYSKNSREFILYTSDNSRKIIFGGMENIEDKIMNLHDFLKYDLQYNAKREFSYIDVRWKNSVIVKNNI
jgi:cell division septal protein FtsQ